MQRGSRKRYVAVKAHVLSECGRGLLELLRRVAALGDCSLGEGLLDALSIASDAGDRELVLVGCVEPASGDWVEVSTIPPLTDLEGVARAVESGSLWPGLAGDVSVDGSVEALRVFLARAFTVVRVSAVTSESAYELALEALRKLCGSGEAGC